MPAWSAILSLEATIKLTRTSGFDLDIQLKVPSSGITALYGPTGSGKTTLLRCIAGLERGTKADDIRVNWAGSWWQNQHQFVAPHKRGIGYVFQDAKLLPHLTVQGNLDFACKRNRSGIEADLGQIIDWLSLESLLDKSVQQLSGGETQQVAIARALAAGPGLILMDEPLSALDQGARGRILSFLDRLHDRLSVPTVYVSHSLEEITYLADNIILLHQGRVTASGSVFDISSRTDLAMSREESAGSVISCTIQKHDAKFGLSELQFDGGHLYVTQRHEPVGSHIRVRIPARDVSITLTPDSSSSILNIMPAKVETIEPSDKARFLVRLAVGKHFLLARITGKSVQYLNLKPGQTVYAQIKSVALLSEHMAH
jgi:molybdate transport system ATP-binding protein